VVGGGTGLFASGASDFQLVRYNGDGTLDSSFGGGGIVTTDFGASDNIFGIAVTADGKIIAAGGTKGASPGDFAVARYNADGSPDSTFDGDGRTTTDFSADSDDVGGVVVQPTGSITGRIAGWLQALRLPSSGTRRQHSRHRVWQRRRRPSSAI
jgi:uncharacterized delta-60 repeat protein